MSNDQTNDLNRQLERNIKEIIDEFPPIGAVLEEAGVDCVSCTVGTCKLKDIIEIHNLSAEQEQALMSQIAGIIFPGEDVEIQKIDREVIAASEIKYSPPIKGLVEEHALIKELLSMMPSIIKKLDINSIADRGLVKEVVNFIRQYADKYHHAKEEEILFKYFDENLDILQVMYEDHNRARNHVKNILAGLREKNADTVKENLNQYMELLTEHIKKENEILYPWLDKNLTGQQVDEIDSKFKESNRNLKDTAEKNKNFIEGLSNRIK